MERCDLPALTPLEGAMLPAIELKGVHQKSLAALHTAFARWDRSPTQVNAKAMLKAKPAAPDHKRLLSRAAYVYAVKKWKG